MRSVSIALKLKTHQYYVLKTDLPNLILCKFFHCTVQRSHWNHFSSHCCLCWETRIWVWFLCHFTLCTHISRACHNVAIFNLAVSISQYASELHANFVVCILKVTVYQDFSAHFGTCTYNMYMKSLSKVTPSPSNLGKF